MEERRPVHVGCWNAVRDRGCLSTMAICKLKSCQFTSVEAPQTPRYFTVSNTQTKTAPIGAVFDMLRGASPVDSSPGDPLNNYSCYRLTSWNDSNHPSRSVLSTSDRGFKHRHRGARPTAFAHDHVAVHVHNSVSVTLPCSGCAHFVFSLLNSGRLRKYDLPAVSDEFHHTTPCRIIL